MVLGLKRPFLPLCSSPEIMLVRRTLLYATGMNLLSVRVPASTTLNYWDQKHFTFFFQTEMTMQCNFQFS